MRKLPLRPAVRLPAAAAVVGIIMTLSIMGAPSGAMAADNASPPPTNTAALLRPARPYWIELTLAQREALAPLGDDWERLDVQTKKKWVEIAGRYPKMKPEERQHVQDRMREWAMLTPDQRRVARDSFARVRAMPPEQRAEVLRKYQELPDDRKKQLATESKAVKTIVVPKPQPGNVAPSPRRAQLTEGTKVKNPAVAAQKSAAPPAVKVPAPVAPPVPAPVPEAPKPLP